MRAASIEAHLRPHLLPAVTLCYLGGAALSGFAAPRAAVLKPLLMATLLLFVLTFCQRQRPVAVFSLLLAFVLTGAVHTGFGLLPPSAPDHLYQLFPEKAKATLTGTVRAMPEFDGRTTRFILDADSVLLHGEAPERTVQHPARGRIRLSLEAELPPDIHAGARLLVMATVSRTFSYRTPGVFDYRLHMADRAIYVTGRIEAPAAIVRFTDLQESPWQRLRFFPETLRQQLNGFLASTREPKEAAMYQALLLGNQSGLDDQTLEQYKATGCMHILSISGVHMALLGLMLTWVFTWLLKRSTWLLLHTHVPTVAILLSLIPLVGYATIAGLNTPVVRALLMSVLFLVGVVLQRQRSLLPLIAAAALFILLCRPLALFTVSFQLSFSAVVALAVIYPRLLTLLSPEQPVNPSARMGRYLYTGLLVSVAATVGSLPFLLYHFNRFSLIGPLINLLVEPILCFWTLPCGLLSIPLLFIAPETARFLLDIGGVGIAAADRITALASTLPLASLWTITPSPAEIVLYVLLLWSWVYRQASLKTMLVHCAAAILLLALFTRGLWLPRASGETEVAFLDVGQGSSSFIRLPAGDAILLDGGSKGSPGFDIGERVLAPFLWKNRIWRLDDVVVTHPDSDHYNGLPFVLRRFRPGRLWINGADKDTWPYSGLLRTARQSGTEIREPAAGEIFKADGDVQLRFVNGAIAGGAEQREGQSLSGNNRSLVLRLTHGDIAILFPGDLEQQGEELLLREGKNIKANVLLAGHHGSRGASSPPFIGAVNPELIIVSAGRNAKSGYLDQDHLAAWHQAGRTVLATALDGTVTVRTDGQRITVRTFAD
ncbi:MAG: DNA internalization-related competence protein ComEC/Rec2 [Desulfobulbaceae bacterium]